MELVARPSGNVLAQGQDGSRMPEFRARLRSHFGDRVHDVRHQFLQAVVPEIRSPRGCDGRGQRQQRDQSGASSHPGSGPGHRSSGTMSVLTAAQQLVCVCRRTTVFGNGGRLPIKRSVDLSRAPTYGSVRSDATQSAGVRARRRVRLACVGVLPRSGHGIYELGKSCILSGGESVSERSGRSTPLCLDVVPEDTTELFGARRVSILL